MVRETRIDQKLLSICIGQRQRPRLNRTPNVDRQEAGGRGWAASGKAVLPVLPGRVGAMLGQSGACPIFHHAERWAVPCSP